MDKVPAAGRITETTYRPTNFIDTCRHKNAYFHIKGITFYIKKHREERLETLWEKSIVSEQKQVYLKFMETVRVKNRSN